MLPGRQQHNRTMLCGGEREGKGACKIPSLLCGSAHFFFRTKAIQLAQAECSGLPIPSFETSMIRNSMQVASCKCSFSLHKGGPVASAGGVLGAAS